MTRSHPLCMGASFRKHPATRGHSSCDVTRTFYLRPNTIVDEGAEHAIHSLQTREVVSENGES